MSTTGWEDGPPTATGAQIGDSGHRHPPRRRHPRRAAATRTAPAAASGSRSRCRTRCSTSAGSSCATSSAWPTGPLERVPEHASSAPRCPAPATPRAAASPASAVRCKPGGPNDYLYVIIQPQGWEPLMKLVGREDLVDHPDYATPQARLPHLDECFALIESWTIGRTKLEAMDDPQRPRRPLRTDPRHRRAARRHLPAGARHDRRGRSTPSEARSRPSAARSSCPTHPSTITTSPLLGQHTDDILHDLLHMDDHDIDTARATGAI